MVVKKTWIGSKKTATQNDLSVLHEMINAEMLEMEERLASREDLERFATKDDLKDMEERMEERFATKADLKDLEERMEEKFATRKDLQEMETRLNKKFESILKLIKGMDERSRNWERGIVALEVRR